MAHVDDLIEPRPEQILLAGLPPLPWPHLNPSARSAREKGTTASDSRESQNTICEETATGQPKTGKYDYFTANIHPARSMAWEFFTDDQ
jgi:hypothetical protein